MEASEIIALTAVLVTGIGAAFTVGVNAWLGNKRLASDERMHSERIAHDREAQTERLTHERAEAVRTTAARAFSAADAVVRHVNQNTIHVLARNEDSEFGARQAISQAMDDLGFVSALGWNTEVRNAAQELLEQISKLANVVWAHAGAIRRGNDTTRMMDRLEEREEGTMQALDAYLRAVST